MGMELIETIEVNSTGPNDIVFYNVPQDGIDLILILSGRSKVSGSADCYVNLGSSGGYGDRKMRLYGNGTNGSSGIFSTANSPHFRINSTSTTSNTFANVSIHVLNYSSTSQTERFISYHAAVENNATTAEWIVSGSARYTTTNAVTQIGVGYSAQFAEFSTASLYKVTSN
tara:strand:+ start:1280 stop:1792 length:513 start_codon:yes stop_codon:yes gene_type:complete